MDTNNNDKADSHQQDPEHDEMFAGANTRTTRSSNAANRPFAHYPSEAIEQDPTAPNDFDSLYGGEEFAPMVDRIHNFLNRQQHGDQTTPLQETQAQQETRGHPETREQRHSTRGRAGGKRPSVGNPYPGGKAGPSLRSTTTRSQPLAAISRRPAGGSHLQDDQKERSEKSGTSHTAKSSQRKTRHAKSTTSNTYNNRGVLGQGAPLDNTGSSTVPGYSQEDTSILDPTALGLISNQGRGDPGHTASSFGRNFFEQNQRPARHLSYAQGNNVARPPQKVYVSESEIDFEGLDDLEGPDTEYEVVEQRSQKRKKKEGSKEVAGKQDTKDRKPKGQVRKLKNGSGVAFKDSKNPQWTKGQYHYKLREQFIAADESSQAPYECVPIPGGAVTDVTSWCTDQKDWTSDCQTIRDPNRRKLLDDDYVSGEFVEKKPPDWLLEDGTVVLDTYGHPVRKFPNIPSTLSSELEAWRGQGLRALNKMTINDLIARMPKYTETWRSVSGTTKLVKERLQGPSAFTNRVITWRNKEGMPPPGKGRASQRNKEGSASQQFPDNEGPQGEGRRKRRKLGGSVPSNNNKGTAAQRATTQIRDRKAKAPRGMARGQVGPKSPVLSDDQTPEHVQPTHWPPLAEPPPYGHPPSGPPLFGLPPQMVGINPSAAFNTNINRGPMVDPEAEYPSQSPTQNPTYYPTAGDHHPAVQPVNNPGLLHPPHSAPPTFPSGPYTQPQAIDPTIFAGGPYIQNEPPDSTPAFGQQLTGDYSSQPSSRSEMQYPNPELKPFADSPYGHQQPDPSFRSNEPTSHGLNTINNTQVQAASEFDFQDHEPTYQEESASQGLDGNSNTHHKVPQLPDLRDQEPIYETDMVEIELALARTQDSFAAVHEYERLPETVHASYNWNRYLLQLEHQRLCNLSGEPVTPLLGLGPWYGDFENHVYATRD